MVAVMSNLKGPARRTLIRQEILRRMKNGESLNRRAILAVTGGSMKDVVAQIHLLQSPDSAVLFDRENEAEAKLSLLEDALHASQVREMGLRRQLHDAHVRLEALETATTLLQRFSVPTGTDVNGGGGGIIDGRIEDVFRHLLLVLDEVRQIPKTQSQSRRDSTNDNEVSGEITLLKAQLARVTNEAAQSAKRIRLLRERLAECGLPDD